MMKGVPWLLRSALASIGSWISAGSSMHWVVR